MKVLVDSSVWGDFFNGYTSAQANALAGLIDAEEEICTCGVIVSEVFQGLRREKSRSRIAALFQELIFLEAADFNSYLKATEIYRDLHKRGKTIRSTIDCLIAIIGHENGCFLLAKDQDLDVVVQSDLLGLSMWPS